MEQKIFEAASYIKEHVSLTPTLGLVLGSGLGDYADTLEDRQVLPYRDIPHFPQPTVAGHAGALVFGKKNGKTVVALQGRLHFYEGHAMQTLTMPIRVLKALGVETVVLTNACGGVNLSFKPGDLMLLTDHINFSGQNPLVGPNLDSFGPRFPDMSDIYTAALRERVLCAAEQAGICLRQGVYAMYSGPNYETPAEIRMFRTMGADVVGMSTVPEALVAAHCGMQVIGISCITNMAAGVLPVKLSHAEVVETAALVHDTFHRLVDLIVGIC